MQAVQQLQLAPLGAGDLIDRTVRLYRRHFMALIRASAPPVVTSAVGTVLLTVGGHALGLAENRRWLIVYFLLSLLGIVLWAAGSLLQLIVMGGATRNLVMHLLRDEPVTARAIYRSVRSRFWGLVGATLAVVACVLFAGGLALFAFYVVMLLIILGAAFAGQQLVPVWLAAAAGVVTSLAALAGALYIFFLVAGRVAYVPQVMLVEGRGVFASVGRSSRLARGNVRRLMAMFLFATFATQSALMLLMIPLGWYGYLHGVNPVALDAGDWPVWYSVGYQVVAQLSTILLAPVWMLGMSLLYVDERVRHEGYDIELLAAQRLGEMPAVPYGHATPLTPAIVTEPDKAAERFERTPQRASGSVLGLTDRR